MAGNRTLLSSSHGSSIGAYICPIYHQEVSVEKGSVIIRYKWAELIKEVCRSHVSSTTGGCTWPIYYQGVVSIEKGSVIIRSLSKMPLRRGTPLFCSHASNMTMARSRTLLSRSHVLNMTGGCTRLIYYRRDVNVEKGSVIIRYQLPELNKNDSYAGNPALLQPCFKHDYGKESNPGLPQSCFKHDRRMYSSDILPKRCWCRKRKCNNSIPITWA